MSSQVIDIQAVIKDHKAAIDAVEKMVPQIKAVAEKMVETVKKGGTIYWMGNGGSAADAQHMSAELIGRFKRERPAIRSIALTTDSSILTCLSNDYDYSIIFARQLEAFCKPEDLILGLSTSGNSSNVLKAVEFAKSRGAYTVGLAGHQGGKLAQAADICLTVPVSETARIQEGHTLICHILCEYVEAAVS